MTLPVDISSVTPAERMVGEDADETCELFEMLARAQSYLRAFPWCPPIAESYLGSVSAALLPSSCSG